MELQYTKLLIEGCFYDDLDSYFWIVVKIASWIDIVSVIRIEQSESLYHQYVCPKLCLQIKPIVDERLASILDIFIFHVLVLLFIFLFYVSICDVKHLVVYFMYQICDVKHDRYVLIKKLSWNAYFLKLLYSKICYLDIYSSLVKIIGCSITPGLHGHNTSFLIYSFYFMLLE